MKKSIHLNKPQLKSVLVGAPVEYLIAGRGTGKTEGVLAYKTAYCYFGTMPRSSGVALGATYNQLLTRTLPSLIAGWERMGYILGEHYLIGKKPTDKWIRQWNWKGPYRPPLDYKYFISWWNGSGCHMVSQDRVGSSNGITIDWIFGDELKLINGDRLRTELLPANRGVVLAYKNNPYHHGMTFTTDMPIGSGSRWIFDMEQQMDTSIIKQILSLQKVIWDLKVTMKTCRKPIRLEILKQIDVLTDEINDLRKGLVLFHEASSLDNIHALGADYFKQQLRDTTQFQFDTQILNIRPKKLEAGFYPDFDEDIHGYFAADNSYLDKLDFELLALNSIDCMRDADRMDTEPLHIAIDYNRRIHPIVVGQVHHNTLKVINGIHSMFPEKLKEAVDKFCNYYKAHKRKTLFYWYDATAVGDDNATRKCDEVISQLRKNGWVVIPMYMKLAPSHESKYRMYGHLLKADGYYNYNLMLNRENCDKLILSVYKAGAEQRKDGYGKDKRTEHDENFPADESTHYSDALDMWVYGILESKLNFKANESNDMIMM